MNEQLLVGCFVFLLFWQDVFLILCTPIICWFNTRLKLCVSKWLFFNFYL